METRTGQWGSGISGGGTMLRWSWIGPERHQCEAITARHTRCTQRATWWVGHAEATVEPRACCGRHMHPRRGWW